MFEWQESYLDSSNRPSIRGAQGDTPPPPHLLLVAPSAVSMCDLTTVPWSTSQPAVAHQETLVPRQSMQDGSSVSPYRMCTLRWSLVLIARFKAMSALRQMRWILILVTMPGLQFMTWWCEVPVLARPGALTQVVQCQASDPQVPGARGLSGCFC
jgi:hypothetical protein